MSSYANPLKCQEMSSNFDIAGYPLLYETILFIFRKKKIIVLPKANQNKKYGLNHVFIRC